MRIRLRMLGQKETIMGWEFGGCFMGPIPHIRSKPSRHPVRGLSLFPILGATFQFRSFPWSHGDCAHVREGPGVGPARYVWVPVRLLVNTKIGAQNDRNGRARSRPGGGPNYQDRADKRAGFWPGVARIRVWVTKQTKKGTPPLAPFKGDRSRRVATEP